MAKTQTLQEELKLENLKTWWKSLSLPIKILIVIVLPLLLILWLMATKGPDVIDFLAKLRKKQADAVINPLEREQEETHQAVEKLDKQREEVKQEIKENEQASKEYISRIDAASNMSELIAIRDELCRRKLNN